MTHRNPLIAAAIDIGTTHSGWAFSLQTDFESNPEKVFVQTWRGVQLVSHKAPTCVLIRNDGETVDSFGYDAEKKYAEIVDCEDPKQWYFFQHFKMMLFEKSGIGKNLLEDASGRKLPAINVVSLVIRYLTDDLINVVNNRLEYRNSITRDDVHWVLTVPAKWNDADKQFMRKAAELAGIDCRNLTIALESEAAYLYCRCLPEEGNVGDVAQFEAGSKYLLLDAGGDVNTTVHEITSSGTVRELHQASGGEWGGKKVDEAFKKFVIGLVDPVKMNEFDLTDYIDLFRDFECRKRTITPQTMRKITCRIPMSLITRYEEVTQKVLKDTISSSKHANQVGLVRDKLRIDAEVIKGFISGTVKSIVNHVRELLRIPAVTGCSAIVLVGGFSESPILQDEIRRAFPEKKIIIPKDAGLAVLKGAVILGHTPRAITERVYRYMYTYGTSDSHVLSDACSHPQTRCENDCNGVLRCYDIFRRYVQMGQIVRQGEEQPERIYHPTYDDQTWLSLPIYAASVPNPSLTIQKECRKVGDCTIPFREYDGMQRGVGVRLVFGGTGLDVIMEDKTTGNVTRDRLDLIE